jgi:hypothetical protein
MLTRRQILSTAAALPTVAVSLSAAGCGGPNPLDVALDRRPPLSGDVRALLAAVTAEQDLIDRYNKTLAAYSSLAGSLRPLLAEHRAHLDRLRAQISFPRGYVASPSPSAGAGSGAGTVPASKNAAVAALRSAESSAASAQLSRLTAVGPSSAELLASIAAAEVTHVDALGGTA